MPNELDARAEALLDAYDAETANVPLGHEDRSRGRSTYNWRRAIVSELRARLAALPEREGLGVKALGVKALEWHDHPDREMWWATGLFGSERLYEIEWTSADGFHLSGIGGEPDQYLNSMDEAKSAAQADYESRIRSALSAPAERGVEEPVAWRWHWRAGDEPDVWTYSESKVESDTRRVAAPLYAAPPPPAGMVMVPRDVLAMAGVTLASIAFRGNDNLSRAAKIACDKFNDLLTAPGQPAQGDGTNG